MYLPKRNKFLITGFSSGLGKYLRKQLNENYYRESDSNVVSTDVIIHCAFNKEREINSKNLYKYLSDNIFLTEKLTKIPHKKFIYISSVDVYPKNNKKHSEDEVIDINQLSGVYAITKLMSESIIQKMSPNFLILRCTALLGKDASKNSLIKILKDKKPNVSLSPESIFNYILHKDVLEFINLAIEKDLQGIYNLASSKNISLLQVSELLKKDVNFGNYIYTAGKIDNKKSVKLLSSYRKTSKDKIMQFIKE